MTGRTRKATTRPQTVTKPAIGQPSDYQRPQDTVPTPAKGWKKAGALLTLPSGNTMRLKNPGIMELAHAGLVPNNLMSTIMSSIQTGQQPDAEQLMEGVEIDEMFEMMANAIMAMAVEPEVHPVPVWDEKDNDEGRCTEAQIGKPAEAKKNDELLYIDEISEEDKMFVWQWATGGTTDVEQFRAESRSVLATFSGQPAMAVPAKRAAPRKR